MLYIASLKSEMTETSKYYVYTGYESDMVHGYWYYWDGSKWTKGGEYEGAIDEITETDSTFSVSGMPVDAKAVGDRISELTHEIESVRETNLLVPGTTVTPILSAGTRYKLVINNNE